MNNNKLKNKSELKIWFESLIDIFREELKEINPENLDHLPHTYNFEFPCQIELFWLDAALQYQILIITHEIDRPDKEIIINGPYYNKEFLDKIKIVMMEKRWEKTTIIKQGRERIEKEVPKSFTFAPILKSFINLVKNSYFYLSKTSIMEEGLFFNGTIGHYAIISGDIRDILKKSLIRRFISELERRKQNEIVKLNEKKTYQNTIQKKASEPIGFGAYILPRIYIGKFPQRKFDDILNEYTFPKKERLEILFHKVKLIFESDGFTIVLTKDKHLALKILNCVFGTLMMYGIKCMAIRNQELTSVYNFINMTALGTLRSKTIYQLGLHDKNPKEISKNEIKDLIKMAEKIYSNQKFTDMLILFLEGYTLFRFFEFSQSFIVNWLLFEKYISYMWQKFYLEDLKDEKHRIREAEKLDNQMTVHCLINSLRVGQKISENEFRKFMELKEIRNQYIHKGKLINETEALMLQKTCEKIIFNLIDDYLNKIH